MSTVAANLSNEAISQYAESVGKHHQLYDDNGRSDVRELVAKLGGTIEYARGTEALNVKAPGTFTVYLPHYTSASRDRFTIAHELAHYFLHYRYAGLSGEASFQRGSRSRAETEANVFASSLLMPEESFRRVWVDNAGDQWKVAIHFDVSPAAATVRAQVLAMV